QTVDFALTRELQCLPGSTMFQFLYCHLVMHEPWEILVSFQSTRDFVEFYHDKLHSRGGGGQGRVKIFDDWPCSALITGLGLIYSTFCMLPCETIWVDLDNVETRPENY